MPDNELSNRIRRIYASLGSVEEKDLSQFRAKVIRTNGKSGFYQDWKGDRSYEEISNHAILLIHNISNLKDNLKHWAKRNDKDRNIVENAFHDSRELNIVQDLSNNDKHGYPPRDGGFSGESPRVEKFERVMKMTVKGVKRSFVSMTFDKKGVPIVSKSGSSEAKVVITGDILDSDGNTIGDLYETLLKAINDWENVLREFAIPITSD